MRFNFFKKAEQPAELKPIDFDRLLEVMSDETKGTIDGLVNGIVMNGGRFTPEDNNRIAQLARSIETKLATQGFALESEEKMVDHLQTHIASLIDQYRQAA